MQQMEFSTASILRNKNNSALLSEWPCLPDSSEPFPGHHMGIDPAPRRLLQEDECCPRPAPSGGAAL